MKKMIFFNCILLLLVSGSLTAQGKFYTKGGKISFFSSTSMEDIEAINRSVTALLDTKSGDLQFSLLMKGFEFKKALMQEHFNAKYVESDKYPRAQFKGQVINNTQINYSADGSYDARVKGKLTIHGQTKDIEIPGTIIVKDGKPVLNSVFN
ncbi:MAG TPA: YceI family protein, partial [Chitinophagaceae bacterium]|nr:YceI family protein [Chitinophagaceae bacterium]